MFKFFGNKSEEYLERTKDESKREATLSSEMFDTTVRELTSRLTENPWKDEGVMSFELPKEEGKEVSTCAIEYDSTHDETLYSYLNRFSTPDYWDDRPKGANYRKIKGLTIRKGKEILDLKDLCEKYSIYYYITDTQKLSLLERMQNSNGQIGMNREGILVETETDPTSILGLFVLMHEIGHAIETPYVSEENHMRAERREEILGMLKGLIKGKAFDKYHVEKPSVKKQEKIMRGERNASAFALRVFRKFLSMDYLIKIKQLGVHYGIKNHFDVFNEDDIPEES